jgi:hypothetical protein
LLTADLDGDGHLDVFIGGWDESDRLYLGDGRGGFLLASPAALGVELVPWCRYTIRGVEYATVPFVPSSEASTARM